MARSYHKGEEPVPGYRLLEPLGRGGFGEVWKASGPGGIPVALKLIPLSGRHGYKELRAIQRVKLIRHPNLVPITAFWLKDEAGKILDDAAIETATGSTPAPGRGAIEAARAGARPVELIMAMGLGDKSLFDRLDECLKAGSGGIPWEELLGYMEDAARAIDHLNSPRHDLGSGPVAIQHCDIKPQNIMIVGGAAQVCDFGLARVLGDIRVTSAAMSPAYAAPECLKDNQPSEFTDQYSLAISYCELRTGNLPFDSDSYLDVVNAHLQGSQDLSKLTEAERAVIRRALAVNPTDRYPTTLAMVRALRQALEGQKEAPPPRPAQVVRGEVLPGHELVPGYKLVRSIMHTGFDEVWEALAPGGKSVAVLVRRLSSSTTREDFLALDLLEGIEHLHITEPHAFWLLDRDGVVISDEHRCGPQTPALSMLVIAGKLARKNLGNRLEECRGSGSGIPLPELLDYMGQLASAIDFLNAPQHRWSDHNYAIFHRDVRPANIMLQGQNVRLGNFSLARVAEEPSPLVQCDPAGLDARYAAPETHIGLTTRWSDQYSLAISYYQLRTGSFPFDEQRSQDELAEIHKSGRLYLGRLSDREQQVIARATATAAEDRFSSCAELVDALREACSPPAPPSEPPRAAAITPTPRDSVAPAPVQPPPATPTTSGLGLASPLTPVAKSLSQAGLEPRQEQGVSPVQVRETQRPITETAETELRGTMVAQPQFEPVPAGRLRESEPAQRPPAEPAAATAREVPARLPATTTTKRRRRSVVGLVTALVLAAIGSYFAFRETPRGTPEPTPVSPPTKPGPEITQKPPVDQPVSPPSKPTGDQPDLLLQVRERISNFLESRQFGEALNVIKGESSLKGDDASRLREQVLTAWLSQARLQLGEGQAAKAASTALDLLKSDPDREEAYQTLSEAMLADEAVPPSARNLDVLRKAPAQVARNREFIERLSKLQERWVRNILPTLAKPEDYVAFLAELAAVEAAAPEASNGWMKSSQVECLLEKGDSKLSKEEVEFVGRVVAHDDLGRAGVYGSYVRGLVLSKIDKKSDEAALAMLEVPVDELKTPVFNSRRRDRMATILTDAAMRMRQTIPTTLEQATPDPGHNPFRSPERAETAARCIERAMRLNELAGIPTSPTARWCLAQAAWYKPEPDRARTQTLTDQLLKDPARSQLDADILSLLLLNIAAQDDTPEGNRIRLQGYATVLDTLESSEARERLEPLKLYNVVVEPALKVSEELAKREPTGSQEREAIARIYATKGQIIIDNRFEAWPFEDKAREAVESLKRATMFNDRKGEYFAGLALAHSYLPNPDLAEVHKFAERAVELDPTAMSHGILGYARLLQSRTETSPLRVVGKLREGIDAIDKAIVMAQSEEDRNSRLATFLSNGSTAYVELAYPELDREKRALCLNKARGYAEDALRLKSRYPELARTALGNALEAMGTVLGETGKLEAAIRAYTEVIDARPDSGPAWLARGRCEYKLAAQQLDRPGLGEAIADLEKACGLNPADPQSHYWLGKAYALRRDYAASDASFLEALQLADQLHKLREWTMFAEDWTYTAMFDVKTGLSKRPPDPVQIQRLNQFRTWAEAQKQDVEKSLVAGWMLGQSLELEGKYREAIKEYDQALPRDLSQAEPKHIKLLLARSQCRANSDELWGEDLKMADAAIREAPRAPEQGAARPPTLRPMQAIIDADRAADLAQEDPLTKVHALTLAAVARTGLANARRGTARELELRQEAVRLLIQATELAPTLSDTWVRRERLAKFLNAIYLDKNLKIPDSQRQAYRQDALRQIDLALDAPEPSREDRGRLAGLRAEIASK